MTEKLITIYCPSCGKANHEVDIDRETEIECEGCGEEFDINDGEWEE